jgi:VIT1/CCC1 family predicted Fe2+/Mn2+ transporter
VPLRAQHRERHFTAGATVRDLVLGMADGLTVPFALAAGLSGAVASTHVVVVAGVAEIAAGAIAMGLGGYLAARSDAEHYARERVREFDETGTRPHEEAAEVAAVLETFGLTPAESAPVVASLRRRPEAWVDFLMRFELGLERPDPARALRSALTIGGAYVAGGAIPLAPYVLLPTARAALATSAACTLVALGVFGWLKGRVAGSRPWRSAVETMLIGGVAAAAAYAIARAVM